MNNAEKAIRQHLSKPDPGFGSACGCMGPQDGEPVCPCAMRWVELVDNEYYRIVTHRSPDGITHSAEHLGNVGDFDWSNPKPKPTKLQIAIERNRLKMQDKQ